MTFDEKLFAALPIERQIACVKHWSWLEIARPQQKAPDDYLNLFWCAGRGFGKTRSAAEETWWKAWTNDNIRVAVIAPTFNDARTVCFEGESGLLGCCPPEIIESYNKSNLELKFKNGSVLFGYSTDDPNRFRGPQFHLIWFEEISSFFNPQEIWDMTAFGLRLGAKPQRIITSTPKPIELVRYLASDPKTTVIRGSTYDNKANLPKTFFDELEKYEGTQLGRQELYGEICDDVPGALWTRDTLDACKLPKRSELPPMQRVVVAIDPASKASSEGEETAETGIVCVGLGTDAKGYLIWDASCRLAPEGWARTALSVYNRFEADAIVAEINQGGDMVESIIKSIDNRAKVIKVRASRGKVTRAEPISALYAQSRIKHIGAFPILEDQMVLFTPFGIVGKSTADRVDALVWGFTELFPRMIQRVEWDDDEGDYVPEVARLTGRSQLTGY